jgi:hypothetical protein
MPALVRFVASPGFLGLVSLFGLVCSLTAFVVICLTR